MKQLSTPVLAARALAAAVALPGIAQDPGRRRRREADCRRRSDIPTTRHVTAEPAPLAARSLILDVADGGDRAIAVGERGHVLVSESRRGDWRQVENVPTRSTLTGGRPRSATTSGPSATTA